MPLRPLPSDSSAQAPASARASELAPPLRPKEAFDLAATLASEAAFARAALHEDGSHTGSRVLCLFTDSLDPSGVGEHMLQLAGALSSAWRVTFACPRGAKGDPFLERACASGLQVLAIEPGPDGLPSMEPVREWLRLNPNALFHAHAGIGWEGHEAIYEARRAGCAVVRTEHLPYLITDEEQTQDHKRLLGSVDRLICVSQAALSSFVEQGLEPSRIRAVRNGIEPRVSSVEPAQARQDLLSELGLPPSASLLLTVGRFTAQKGHEFLLHALPLLDELQPDSQAYLLWVGQGEERASLEALASELGLGERVLFLGQRSDVGSLLRASDAFVLPSLFEGLPLVALEAMAGGLPIVGTRVCGTEEAIESDEFGWLVPPRDPQALAQSLAQVLAQPGEAARRAERARRRVLRDFSAERMARETERVYHEALELRAGKG